MRVRVSLGAPDKDIAVTRKETLEKAYGNVPKELPVGFELFDVVPTWRGIKYYWYKLTRKITGR